MPKKVEITPEVRAVLAGATVTGSAERPILTLPEGQLERTLYQSVAKVLTALGGKWDRRAAGFLFDRPFEAELSGALESGVAVDAARTAEQFFTPPSVARRVFDLADLRADHHVLEPSAGRGALLVEPIRLGCAISAVEQDLRLAGLLADMLADHGSMVAVQDFMDWLPPAGRQPIDRVLMNPPFSRGQDIAHVRRAYDFVRPGGRLVAVMPPGWTHQNDGPRHRFRAWLNERAHAGDHRFDWEALPAASFRSSGTDVETGVLTITKGE